MPTSSSDSLIDSALAAEIAQRELFVIPTLSIHDAFEAGEQPWQPTSILPRSS